jgi:hypothetical protein
MRSTRCMTKVPRLAGASAATSACSGHGPEPTTKRKTLLF